MEIIHKNIYMIKRYFFFTVLKFKKMNLDINLSKNELVFIEYFDIPLKQMLERVAI